MKLLNIYKIFVLFTIFIIISIPTTAEIQKEKKYVPGQILIKFKKQALKTNATLPVEEIKNLFRIDKIEQAFPQKNISANKNSSEENLSLMHVGYVSQTTDIELLAIRMKSSPFIEYAEPNYFVEINAIPNDPLYSQLQHLPQVKAPQAWDVSQGDTSVIIAILDTGVDWDHPDLADAIWRNYNEIPDNGIDDDGNGFVDDIRGWDFVTGVSSNAYAGEDGDIPDNNPMDFNGHGTHVAGIAAGITNNGVGIASLVWKAKIMPIRIGYHTLDGNGLGTLLWMAQGFVYAGDNGAHAANLSFGTGDGNFVNDAARYAFQKGVVICNSAGNGNNEAVGALGATPFALSVASVNENDIKASYSTFGNAVDVSAPGGDALGILSTIVNPSPFYNNNLYVRFSGTSMASPLVASLAGLIKAKNPTWNAAQINFQIVGTADDIYNLNPNYIGKLGSGRINAYRALTETISSPKPKIVLSRYNFFEISGDMDGNFEPGETIGLYVTLENQWGDAINTYATLSSTHWAISITNPTTNYDTIYGISNLNNSSKTNSIPIEFIIHSQMLPEVITLSLNIAADGYTKDFQIDLPVNASIFLVDDNTGNVGLNEYIDAIKSLNGVYRYWDRESQGSPPAAEMLKYSTVIWYADIYVHPFLDSADRANLGMYLDNGGNLFIAGMDFGWDMADPEGTEYKASNGASKVWFENYLRAKYIADGSPHRTITGVTNDPIGNGLSFGFINPWPDVIDTLGGSKPVFRYPDNTLGGIRYAGNYRLVYLGFSSLENIPDVKIRRTILERSISWLNDFSIKVSRVNDTEDTNVPLPVTAEVKCRDSIISVNLAYSKNGERPFNKITMVKIAENLYEASIPPAIEPGDFEYRIIVETNKGILPAKSYFFRAGPDIQPPTLSVTQPIPPSLSLRGPYSASVVVKDNIAVDKDSVFINYIRQNDVTEQRSRLKHWNEDTFLDTFSLSTPVNPGENVYYYFTARDSSSNHNIGRYPETGYLTLIIGREIIEDFENGTSKWNTGSRWGLADTLKYSGKFSITDSPQGNYSPNTKDTLLLIQPVDLSAFSGGFIKFWRSYRMNTGDSVFLDISRNGIDWENIKIYRKIFPWVATISGFDSLEIHQYYGPSNRSVQIRFRIHTNETLESDGIYIDDIEFISLESILEIENIKELPKQYALLQNYPNPFNPITTIKYLLPEDSYVSLKIYNILGQEVRTLLEGIQKAGINSVSWDAINNSGNRVSSGIYIYKLDAHSNGNSSKFFSQSRKMILLR